MVIRKRKEVPWSSVALSEGRKGVGHASTVQRPTKIIFRFTAKDKEKHVRLYFALYRRYVTHKMSTTKTLPHDNSNSEPRINKQHTALINHIIVVVAVSI